MSLTSRGFSHSGQRRRVVRVRAQLSVVVAFPDGEKRQARVIDVSTGGMHVECSRVPQYGEELTVVVRLDEESDWALLPATVRWFSSRGFGVAFGKLDQLQARALTAFVDKAAAA